MPTTKSTYQTNLLTTTIMLWCQYQVNAIVTTTAQMTWSVGREQKGRKREHGDVLVLEAVVYQIWMSVWNQVICQLLNQHLHPQCHQPILLLTFLVVRSSSKCIGSLAFSGKRCVRHCLYDVWSVLNGLYNNEILSVLYICVDEIGRQREILVHFLQLWQILLLDWKVSIWVFRQRNVLGRMQW